MRNVFRNLFRISHVEGARYFVEELSNCESWVKEQSDLLDELGISRRGKVPHRSTKDLT